jgi:hypothetical protein
MSAPLDHYSRAEIDSDIQRVEAILASGIFHPRRANDQLLLSAITELVIRVRDLVAKAEIHTERISFIDDVTVKGKVTDVTSLITYVRDAVCHIDSKKHDHDQFQARISFNVMFGAGCMAEINGVRIESMYRDDVAFFFGPQRLYLRRHIVRAYSEAVAQLKPLLELR